VYRGLHLPSGREYGINRVSLKKTEGDKERAEELVPKRLKSVFVVVEGWTGVRTRL
jgi:hypothetical protein